MKYLIIFAFIFTNACQNKVLQNQTTVASIPQTVNKNHSISTENQSDEFEGEIFTDENKIGKRQANRIEIYTYKKAEKFFVKTKFYSKSQSQWIQKNEVDVERFGELSLRTEIKDFNGDGFNDVTFVSSVAARGANEIRDLFIYNPQKDELIHIKNSSDYPNLGYNPLLKCLDSWIFTGSTMTVFLRLKDDKLIEFASVEDGMTERFIYVNDRNGDKQLLRREKRKDDGFDRYINFNPVRIYKE
ncbi:MAG TPA: hypothetical protein PKE69_07515 [Pyrinomonadaceae bacterium]|nr:hypothetical protein [Pyrinomonadaceae bacterium]